MADDDETGPWLLALGTLAIAVVAAAKILREKRPGRDDTTPRDGGG